MALFIFWSGFSPIAPFTPSERESLGYHGEEVMGEVVHMGIKFSGMQIDVSRINFVGL